MLESNKKPKFVEGLVQVELVGAPWEAALIKAALMDNGIECIILNQHDSSYVVNFGVLSKIKLLVAPEHVDRAKTLISKLKSGESELPEDADIENNE